MYIKKLPFRLLKRIVAELPVILYDPDGSMAKTDKKYKKYENIKALNDLAEELDQKIMVTHFRLARYGIPVHNIGMNLMGKYLLTRFLGKKEMQRLYPILISNLKHKLTETNERIHDVATIIRKRPELRDIILEKDSKKSKNKKYDDFTELRDTYKEKIVDYSKEIPKILKKINQII